MADGKRVQRCFKPWDDNEERLQHCEAVGINPADVINQCLRLIGRRVIEDKIKSLREHLKVPIP